MEQDCQHLAHRPMHPQNARLAARLAEVEAENARLRELALVEAEGQHDEMLGATGLAAERDRLAQELEGLLGFLREVADRRLGKRDTFLSLQLEIRDLLARFPREGDA